MIQRSPHAAAALAALMLLAGCASPPRNAPIAAADLNAGYGYRSAERPPGAARALPGHHVVLAFSGGGTRAAALAQGVLREMEATPTRLPGGRRGTMLDEVDLVSSVSGGSVTAANFALHGAGGFERYESGFLHQDNMATLIGGVVNPVNWARQAFTSESRIDVLVRLLDRTVFHGATYADLIARRRPPFLLLNAADMSSGQPFTFTQSTFDLLCSDLTTLRISEAVTASAAFPVALTPITLTNYSPCPAQQTKAGQRLLSQVTSAKQEGSYGTRAGQRAGDVVFVDTGELAVTTRGQALRKERLLNQGGESGTRYVHLLDGGIADNSGLSEVLERINDTSRDGAFASRINEGEIKDIVFVVVNARSEHDRGFERSASPPGMLSMLLASLDAPIDGRSDGLAAQVALLPVLADWTKFNTKGRVKWRPHIVHITFDKLLGDREAWPDPACRRAFQDLATSWALDAHQVDALMELGGAMLRASPTYQSLAVRAGGAVLAEGGPGGPGQGRARQACARVRGESAFPKPAFGNVPRT